MKQYIRKPTKVEAIQWTGENDKEVVSFLSGKKGDRRYIKGYIIAGNHESKTFKITLARYEIWLERGYYLIAADGFFDAKTAIEFQAEYEGAETKEEKPFEWKPEEVRTL